MRDYKTPLQKLMPFFKPHAYFNACTMLTCLGVTFSEDLCQALYDKLTKGNMHVFENIFMQGLYEIGLEEWFNQPSRPHGYEDFQ